MRRKLSAFRRVPVDFGNESVCPVPIQRRRALRRANGSEQSRDREGAFPRSHARSFNAPVRHSFSDGGPVRHSLGDGGSTFQRNNKSAFTLVEILVVLVLLSLIVFALMAVFSGIQRAFRASLTQTDTLEGGRNVMDLITSDLATMTPSDLNCNEIGAPLGTYPPVNFSSTEQTFAMPYPPAPLPQPLLSSPSGAMRTNILENIFILSKNNINGVPSWVATGYSVTTNLADGTLYPLYRFYMTTNASSGSAGVGMLYSGFASFNYADSTNWSHLMDGVVNLTARVYDTNGVWMTNGYLNPFASHVRFANFLGDLSGVTDSAFFSNAVPASVQVELATLEDRALQHAEGLSGANQSNYLSNAIGQVHVFRQRVWIRNLDPTAYQ